MKTLFLHLRVMGSCDQFALSENGEKYVWTELEEVIKEKNFTKILEQTNVTLVNVAGKKFHTLQLRFVEILELLLLFCGKLSLKHSHSQKIC